MPLVHYHVIAGLRGLYMPDENVTCETQAEARECAAEMAEDWAEARECEAIKVSADYYEVGEHCSVEVCECTHDDCAEDLD